MPRPKAVPATELRHRRKDLSGRYGEGVFAYKSQHPLEEQIKLGYWHHEDRFQSGDIIFSSQLNNQNEVVKQALLSVKSVSPNIIGLFSLDYPYSDRQPSPDTTGG